VIIARCEKWDCPGCRRFLIKKWMIAVRFWLNGTIDAGGKLWGIYCTPDEWEALQRQIRRKGGQCAKIIAETDAEGPDKPLRFLVVTTAPDVSTATETATPYDDAEDLICTVATLLQMYRGSGHPWPLTHSQDWVIPQDDGKPQVFRRKGKASRVDLPFFYEVAERVNAEVVLFGDQAAPSAVIFHRGRQHPWTAPLTEYVSGCVETGEVLPFGWHAPAGPPPRRPRRPEPAFSGGGAHNLDDL
jgi:hypothetical protein